MTKIKLIRSFCLHCFSGSVLGMQKNKNFPVIVIINFKIKSSLGIYFASVISAPVANDVQLDWSSVEQTGLNSNERRFIWHLFFFLVHSSWVGLLVFWWS